MDIGSYEMNVIVATLARNRKKGTEIHGIITTAWGNVISLRRVQQLTREYQEEQRADFERKEGSGRQKSEKRLEIVPLIRDALDANKGATCEELAQRFNTNHRMVYDVITEELSMRSVHDRWVPHTLSLANKNARIACCRNIKEAFVRRNIHRDLIVVDEKWFYARPLGCPQTLRSWVPIDGSGDRGRNAKRSTMERKHMAVVAVNFQGLSYSKVLRRNETVDSELYCSFLEEVMDFFSSDQMRRERRAVEWRNMTLMQDNAKPHVSRHTISFLERRHVRLLRQSPYSPDLNLCDRMIFPMLEMSRHDTYLENEAELKAFLDASLSTLSAEVMRREADKLLNHCDAVISASGEYV